MTDEPKDVVEAEDREPRVGSVIAERYRIDALVGSGSMGRVFVGEHVLLRKRVAVKVLHRELGEVREYVQRFEREAMAAANIGNDHVVPATDFGRLPDGAMVLVLDYVEGRNLREEMFRAAFRAERALHIARQIADALESAHHLGIVHRDLKPENVMLVTKGEDNDFVKVLDFGIAKVPLAEANGVAKALTRVGAVFGTPEYMAPEQALAERVDGRTDLYALGVVLYEMITGVLPFASEGEACLGEKLTHPAPPFAERAPSLQGNPAVEALVQKLLARNPNDRFQSAGHLRREIDGLVGAPLSSPPVKRPESPAESSLGPAEISEGPRTAGRESPLLSRVLHRIPRPALLSIGAAVACVLVGVTVFVASRSGDAPASASSEQASAVAAAQAAEKASPSDIASAAGRGAEALLELQRRYPKDADIAMALSSEHLKKKDFLSAVHALGEALSLKPSLKQDAQVASLLWIAAQNRKSSDAAFELLGGPMGERGREILQDLSTTAGVRDDVKARAKKKLRTPDGFEY